MIKGKTQSGFKYEVDERIKTDWRLIKAISESQKSDANSKLSGVSSMVSLVLGTEEQENALIEHIKKKNDGFVPIEAMNAEISEIIAGLPNAKN